MTNIQGGSNRYNSYIQNNNKQAQNNNNKSINPIVQRCKLPMLLTIDNVINCMKSTSQYICIRYRNETDHVLIFNKGKQKDVQTNAYNNIFIYYDELRYRKDMDMLSYNKYSNEISDKYIWIPLYTSIYYHKERRMENRIYFIIVNIEAISLEAYNFFEKKIGSYILVYGRLARYNDDNLDSNSDDHIYIIESSQNI